MLRLPAASVVGCVLLFLLPFEFWSFSDYSTEESEVDVESLGDAVFSLRLHRRRGAGGLSVDEFEELMDWLSSNRISFSESLSFSRLKRAFFLLSPR